MHGHAHHPRDLVAQRFDVLALLADDDSRPGGMNDDTGILRRSLNLNTAHRRMAELFAYVLANCDVGIQVLRIVTSVGVPDGAPVFDDA